MRSSAAADEGTAPGSGVKTGAASGEQSDAAGCASGGAKIDPIEKLIRTHRRNASLLGEMRFFLRIGIGRPTLHLAMRRARRNATTLEAELLAADLLDADLYAEAVADMLGLPLVSRIDPTTIVRVPALDAVLRNPRQVMTINAGGSPCLCLAPCAAEIETLAARLERAPGLRTRLAVATRRTIRSAVWGCRERERVNETVRALADSRPDATARMSVSGLQGFIAGAFAMLLVALLVTNGAALSLAAHLLLTACFLACIAMRIAALIDWRAPRKPRIAAESEAGLPRYTVAVALYREAGMAAQLVGALSLLRWPRALLEIKLICEGDDRETIEALEALAMPSVFEIVRVPAGDPRTKPKALTYALHGATGDFLVVYDAEDRPHPDQLLEAYAAFRKAGEDSRLAVLQAPLVITNAPAGFIASSFAVEYAALFRGLLPFLARRRLPMPLGGTSNHFRVTALRDAGAWDPFNVTEDADLGMRLHRLGYASGTLALPTWEAAPGTFKLWHRQRTRWFKGWCQTWLVLMRRPVALLKSIGARDFIALQLLTLGPIASALCYPLLAVFFLRTAFAIAGGTGPAKAHEIMLFASDLCNILFAPLATLSLARRAMTAPERTRTSASARWGVLLYWCMLSGAAAAAIVDLIRKPHHWAKTPHTPSAQPALGRDMATAVSSGAMTDVAAVDAASHADTVAPASVPTRHLRLEGQSADLAGILERWSARRAQAMRTAGTRTPTNS